MKRSARTNRVAGTSQFATILLQSLARSAVLKLLAKLRHVNAVFCRFARSDKDHWNIPSVALLQYCVPVHIHFAQNRAELVQEGRDCGLGFFAKMATRSSVESYVASPALSKAQVLRRAAHGLGFEYFMKGPECG
jgi:hypothetical protein